MFDADKVKEVEEQKTDLSEEEKEKIKERLKKVKMFVESFEGGMKPHTRRLDIKGKDPEYDYRLVKNKPEFIEYREQMGYELVRAGEVESSSMKQPDGRQVVAGELVVMKRDKLIGEAHRRFLKEKSERMSRSPRDNFKAKARKVNVKVDDESQSRYSSLAEALIGDIEDGEA